MLLKHFKSYQKTTLPVNLEFYNLGKKTWILKNLEKT